jgi:RNA polymerase sigma-70 factor, ECF subfamily
MRLSRFPTKHSLIGANGGGNFSPATFCLLACFIIRDIMTRDNDGFAMIFDEIYPDLCRFLECMLGRHNIAQDIAQETFMRLCRLGADSLPREQARFWLFSVARNLALNEINKTKTRQKLWQKIEGVFQQNETDPTDILEQQEHVKKLRRLLQTLPTDQRASLLLREQEEMSYREIARVLETSESKVKTDIFRARCALRTKWREFEGGN